MKRKKIILVVILSILLLLVSAAVCFFQFHPYGYRMTVPYRHAFEKIEDNVYININYAGKKEEIIERLTMQKKEAVRFSENCSA